VIKIILAFLLLSVAVGIVITAVRNMSGLEKWQLTKVVAYAIMCALLATVLLVVTVLVF
jgi:ABC-type microcin C transport system permease subunit YejB